MLYLSKLEKLIFLEVQKSQRERRQHLKVITDISELNRISIWVSSVFWKFRFLPEDRQL